MILFIPVSINSIAQCGHVLNSIQWGGLLMVAGSIMCELGSRRTGNLDFLIASVVLGMCGPQVSRRLLHAHSILLTTKPQPSVCRRQLLRPRPNPLLCPWLSPIHTGRVVTTSMGCDVIIEALISRSAAMVANSR
jgi:hypothetical protein